MTRSRIGLLTGPTGVGKTTVAERVVGLARQQGVRCGGLVAPAMLTTCGQKVGIWGVDLLSGERRILARTDRDLCGPTIGPYSFDEAELGWAVTVLDRAMQLCISSVLGKGVDKDQGCQLLIVDEIGKLELWQDAGLSAALSRLASGQIPRALVLVRDSLLSELADRLELAERLVFRLDEESRESLALEILDRLLANG